MGYVPGLPEDEAMHSKFCELIINGPRIGTLEGARVIWAIADEQILLVSDISPEEQRKLAHDVSICANREMNYDGGIYHYYDQPDERQRQIFLYGRASHVVAMCLIERRTTVWRCTWNCNEPTICDELPNKTAMWSVSFIWVHKQNRKKGIAYALFNEAKRVLNLSDDDIGWYTPFSEEGKSFVRRLYPTHFFVAK